MSGDLPPEARGPKVVALGGGHGLAASLAALRQVTADLTAVVTVADDGGSSGRLRLELAALPPGDLRMALVALAADEGVEGEWARLLQHRFRSDGPLDGHAVGNLILAGLTEVTGDPVEALDAVGRLVGAAGRVLPLSTESLHIVAEVAGLDPLDRSAVEEVFGQVQIATTPGRVVGVRLEPEEPVACPEAVAAVEQADWVVFGPGSWFTSVLPHLLVPDLAKTLLSARARRLVVLNLAPQPGETADFSPEAHLEVLLSHAPALSIDVVLADEAAVPDPQRLVDTAADLGATVVFAPVAAEGGRPVHDPSRLASAYRRVLARSAGEPRSRSQREAYKAQDRHPDQHHEAQHSGGSTPWR
jgi:uncharacterized cofD-like protein